MIRFVDSASWVTTGALGLGPGLKYKAAAGQFSIPLPGSGPDGAYAYYAASVLVQNLVYFGAQNNWRNVFSLSYSPIGSRWESNFVAWFEGTTCLGSATISNDGYIRIYVGGDGLTNLGAVAYTSQVPLASGVWVSVDLDWYFPTTGKGWCNLYINDVLDTSPASPGGPSAAGINWGGVPDTFGLIANVPFTPGNGFQIADIVVSDGQGAYNNGRLGPCRVDAYFPTANAYIQWPTVTPGTSAAWDTVNDQPEKGGDPFSLAPDGDTSCISGAAAGQEILFSFGPVPCFAGILGLAINATARDSALGSFDFVVRPQPSQGAIGEQIILPGAFPQIQYSTMQAILEQLGGGTIVDGAIENAWWGVNALSGSPVITQLFLEKVTTRRNVPYQCGQLGSYCIGGS